MAKRNPIVSVVMAAYNTKQEYFYEAVESILSQSLDDFELLIIDDGLSEKNRRYLAGLADNRLRVLVNERNVGQSVSVNRGIRAARGKYIARMDSDDIALPGRLDAQVAYMEAHEECIACGGFAERTNDGRVIPASYPDLESREIGLFFACDMIHPTMMLRTSALEEFGISYDEEQLYAQDYMIWADVLRWGEIGIVDEVVLRYRVHGGQITSSKREQQDKYAIRAQRKLFEDRGFDVGSIDFTLHSRFVKYDVRFPISRIMEHLSGLAGQATGCLPQRAARLFRRELGFRALKAGVREIANHGNALNGALLLAYYGMRPWNWRYYAARSNPAHPRRGEIGKETA